VHKFGGGAGDGGSRKKEMAESGGDDGGGRKLDRNGIIRRASENWHFFFAPGQETETQECQALAKDFCIKCITRRSYILVARNTSHVTRHTSHVTRHTSQLQHHLPQFLAKLTPISFNCTIENGAGPFANSPKCFLSPLLINPIPFSIFFRDRPLEAAAAAAAAAKCCSSRPREGMDMAQELATPVDHM
jgi:hypothetical protein